MLEVMAGTADFIPPGDEALMLPVDELGMRLLRVFSAEDDGSSFVHPDHITNVGFWREHDLGSNQLAFFRAVSEAWSWLVAKGLVAKRPDQTAAFHFVTRRGREMAASAEGLTRLRGRGTDRRGPPPTDPRAGAAAVPAGRA